MIAFLTERPTALPFLVGMLVGAGVPSVCLVVWHGLRRIQAARLARIEENHRRLQEIMDND